MISFLIVLSIFFGIVLVIMILLQQGSSNGIISNSTGYFAPGSIDVFKNKVTGILGILFLLSIFSIWFVNNGTKKNKNVSAIDIATKEEKKLNIPTE